jgi:gamma-glutamylcyclotransferase (GGCT)/AIG2-like uncharacterized protein YtfP
MNTNQQLRIFVYGTLKRGYWNHDRFCSQAVHIEPATTWGRLYHLPAGFPALEIPDCRILAHGTADPLADTQIQNNIELPENAMKRPDGDWGLIHGDLITFNNPGIDLPPIDRLEGFSPEGRSMYKRVLVAVNLREVTTSAWAYIDMGSLLIHTGRSVKSGKWSP